MTDNFWLVWSPISQHSPRFRHTTSGAAESEARRLAQQNAGHPFFVLKAESVSVKDAVITRRFPTDDEIPF